ncbi:aspartate/glutamate racemase family protein [bacterium]|jgi:aspartate racemase|nr:aspartate/glutamate racemase family protein [bacterium]
MLGILGGMGPQATQFFYQKIIDLTPATSDQDHIPTLILSDPSLPDRTSAILSNETDEVGNLLIKNAKKLENAGATVIVMPCNTAHYWAHSIQKELNVPFINMIELLASHIKQKYIGKKIGLFSTVGTSKSEIYQKIFRVHDLNVLSPHAITQEKTSQIIKDIKAGHSLPPLSRKIEFEIERWQHEDNIKCFILGCTELPLLFNDFSPDYVIDPMEILAKHVVKKLFKL